MVDWWRRGIRLSVNRLMSQQSTYSLLLVINALFYCVLFVLFFYFSYDPNGGSNVISAALSMPPAKQDHPQVPISPETAPSREALTECCPCNDANSPTPSYSPFDEYSLLKDAIIRNTDELRNKQYKLFWEKIPPSLKTAHRAAWRDFISRVPKDPPTGAFIAESYGIVSTAGNRDSLSRFKTLARFLRWFNCTLPIEVWHFEGEINEEESRKLALMGVSTRNIEDDKLIATTTLLRNGEKTKNFHIKTAAILSSSFQNVLYLDSDNIPLKDPSSLFETPAFADTGALFWPDFWKTHPSNPIWDILEISWMRDEWEQEAGQIVIDKRRHWRPLWLAHYFNLNHEFYYMILNGDKDTFRFAWMALNATMSWSPRFLASLGYEVGDTFAGHTMVQSDFLSKHEIETLGSVIDVNPPRRFIFAHANLLKDAPNELNEDKPFAVLKRYQSDVRSVTWLLPQFRFVPEARFGSIEFLTGEGEPDVVKEDWERHWFPHFNSLYFQLGGFGGGVPRSYPFQPSPTPADPSSLPNSNVHNKLNR